MPILQSLHFSGPLPALKRPGSHFLHDDVWTAPSSGHVAADPPPSVGSAPFSHNVHGSQEPFPVWRGHERKSNDSPTIGLDAVPSVRGRWWAHPPRRRSEQQAACMQHSTHACWRQVATPTCVALEFALWARRALGGAYCVFGLASRTLRASPVGGQGAVITRRLESHPTLLTVLTFGLACASRGCGAIG